MQNTEQRMQNIELKKNERPIAVWVFGILNIVLGCYFLVRIVIGWSGTIVNVFKNPENIKRVTEISLLLFIVSIILIIWLIMLGYGLLNMKRWARRGSIIYAWIMIAFAGIAVIAIIESMVTSWPDSIRVLRHSMSIHNGIAVIQWIYYILLLIFMKTAKVREAFAGIENGSPVTFPGKQLLGDR